MTTIKGPERRDRMAPRDIWACPNGHKDWNRRSTAIVGRHVEFTCEICNTVWRATSEQRTAMLRYLAGKP